MRAVMDLLDASALVGLVLCQNDHAHDPWGVRWGPSGWIFDTSSEAADPTLLCQRVVACLIQVAKARNFNLEKPLRLHDAATAVQNKQTKRHKPLVPEFHHFVKQPASSAIQPGTNKVDGASFRG